METRHHQSAVLLLHTATTPGYPIPAQHSFEENPFADEQIRAALNKPLRRTMKPAGGINSSFQRKNEQVTPINSSFQRKSEQVTPINSNFQRKREQATPNPSPGGRAAAPAGHWVHFVLVTSGES